MKNLIPQKQTIIGYEEQLQTLEYAVKQNMAVLLVGETGVGKTSLIRHLAHKNKRPLRRVNLNGQTTVDEFVGKTLLNKTGTFWQDGVLVEAMRKGYWLVLDEINAALPEILFVLHSLLDDDRFVVLSEKDGEVVRPHENFRVFATMNPSGRYAGTKDLNKAFLSRFPMVIQIEFPNHEQEVQILNHYTELKPEQAGSLTKMASELRAAYLKDDIEYVCSTRDLINCGLLEPQFGIRKAIELSIYAKVPSSDKAAIETVIGLYFGRTETAKAMDKTADLEALNTRMISALGEIANHLSPLATQVTRWKAITSEVPIGDEDKITKYKIAVFDQMDVSFLPEQMGGIHSLIHAVKDLDLSRTEDTADLLERLQDADDAFHPAPSAPGGKWTAAAAEPTPVKWTGISLGMMSKPGEKK